MKTLWEHTVKIYKRPTKKLWREDDEFSIKQTEVLAENDNYIVLNNPYFSKLNQKGDDICYPTLNKEQIRVQLNDHLFSDGVFYKYYSTSKRSPKTIKKHIEEYLKEKFGWFLNDIDLGIIK